MEDLDETIVKAIGTGTTSGTNVFSVTAEVHDEMGNDSWSDEDWNSTEAHQSLNYGQGTHDPRSCSTGGGEDLRLLSTVAPSTLTNFRCSVAQQRFVQG